MGIYDTPKHYFDTLKWGDIFPDKESFTLKMQDVVTSMNSKLEPINELYDILYMRYFNSNTRYTSELAFILALKREMIVHYPIYVQQKKLINEMMELEINEIQKLNKSISNIIDRPTVGLPLKPSEEVIPNLSTQQATSFVQGNKLSAIRDKYFSIEDEYLNKIYNKTDVYFRQIQRDDLFVVYSQED